MSLPRVRAYLLARVTVVLFVLVAVLCLDWFGVNSSPAYADLDCKESPTPQMPGSGIPGWLQGDVQAPPAGDPWAANPSTTVYEQYGYAGLEWTTYDLGCGPDVAREPDAVIGTWVANIIMLVPIAVVAATNAFTEVALEPTFLQTFDPLIIQVTSGLRESVYDQWVPIMILLLGVVLLWKARKADLRSATTAVMWALGVMVLAAMVFNYPVESGEIADESVTQAIGAINASLAGVTGDDPTGDPATQAGANLYEAVLYQQWKIGEFGSEHDAVADQYAQAIFDGSAYTWAEAEIVNNNPVEGEKITSDKESEYGDAAEAIAESNPAAYNHMIGKESEDRIAIALVALWAAICACPFPLIAAAMVIGMYIVVRLAVMLTPLLGTLAVLVPHFMISTLQRVFAAVVNCVAFGAGAAVTISAIGIILDPASELPSWLSLLLVAAFSIVMFVVLKPFRRLTEMVRNPDVMGSASGALSPSSALRSSRGLALKYLATRSGSKAGVADALEEADEERDEQAATVRAESVPADAPPDVPAQDPLYVSSARVMPAPAVAAGPTSAEQAARDDAQAAAAAAHAAPTGRHRVPERAQLDPVPADVASPAPTIPQPLQDGDTIVLDPDEFYRPDSAATALPPPVEPTIINDSDFEDLYRPEHVRGESR